MRVAFLYHRFKGSLKRCLLIVPFAILAVNSAHALQRPGGRDPVAPTPTPTPRKTTTVPQNKPRDTTVKPQVLLADMTIFAPLGSRIWINQAEVDTSGVDGTLLLDRQKVKSSYAPNTGVITLKGLKPGTYSLTARKPDFQEYVESVTVASQEVNEVAIVLIPIRGRLTVAPSIDGANIEIVDVATNMSLGRYAGRLDQFEVSPGQYRVITSKTGYKEAVREISVNPAQSVYLEPLLELLPPPAPLLKRLPYTAPMGMEIQRRDKYLLFQLQGSSGNAGTTSGSINVNLGGPGRNYVSGNLNGLPCSIEFIKLENIAEGAIVEGPGPSNNWTRIVVRIRPKDEKRRPISFAINWSSLQKSSSFGVSSDQATLIPAEVIQKVQPNFPSAARGSPIRGTVLVLVSIDKDGSVVSAKAIEGPYVFRRVSEEAARKWKFRPATRNGQPVESEQVVQFRFE